VCLDPGPSVQQFTAGAGRMGSYNPALQRKGVFMITLRQRHSHQDSFRHTARPTDMVHEGCHGSIELPSAHHAWRWSARNVNSYDHTRPFIFTVLTIRLERSKRRYWRSGRPSMLTIGMPTRRDPFAGIDTLFQNTMP
jgi:hypothetical protein